MSVNHPTTTFPSNYPPSSQGLGSQIVYCAPSPANPSQFLPKKTISYFSYYLNNQIGSGYSSTVFKGSDDRSQNQVAIKVIEMAKINQSGIHKLLLDNEILSMQQLVSSEYQSRHILKLQGLVCTQNNTYIITELCEGDMKQKLLDPAGGKLNEGLAVYYLQQIVEGYMTFYKNGLVHRDLKPPNIFIKNGILKLADFGFALKETECSDFKHREYNVGSPAYMSPEALRFNDYSYKSDVWALGVIYYEMLTGRTPWSHATSQQQLAERVSVQDISQFMPQGISTSSVEFLTRTLCRNDFQRMTPDQLGNFIFYLPDEQEVPMLPKRYTTNGLYRELSQCEKAASISFQFRTPKREGRMRRGSDETTTSTKRYQAPDMILEQKRHSLRMEQRLHHSPAKKLSVFSSESFQTTPQKKQQAPQLLQQLVPKRHKRSFYSSSSEEEEAEALSKMDKTITKHLLSQLHFCRFLHKLIKRVEECCSAPQILPNSHKLKTEITGLLLHRISNLMTYEYVNPYIRETSLHFRYDSYRKTEEFSKFLKIVSQYDTKYRGQLGVYIWDEWVESNMRLGRELKESLGSIYKEVRQKEEKLLSMQYNSLLLVLDQLVTLYQFGNMFSATDLEDFSERSNIHRVVDVSVEGARLGKQEFEKIENNMKLLGLLH